MSRIKKHKLKKNMARHVPKKSWMSKKMVWTLIIGGLMIASVFGIMFSSYNEGKEELSYGDYEFQRTQEGWVVEIAGKKAEFSYFPADLEDMELSKPLAEKLAGSKVIYITFNSSTKNVGKFELMRFELANAFVELFGIYPMLGVTEENEEYKQPIVGCENATAVVPVVSIVEANETNAYLEGDCVVLEANEYSTAAMKDRLLYSMLGIME